MNEPRMEERIYKATFSDMFCTQKIELFVAPSLEEAKRTCKGKYNGSNGWHLQGIEELRVDGYRLCIGKNSKPNETVYRVVMKDFLNNKREEMVIASSEEEARRRVEQYRGWVLLELGQLEVNGYVVIGIER